MRPSAVGGNFLESIDDLIIDLNIDIFPSSDQTRSKSIGRVLDLSYVKGLFSL